MRQRATAIQRFRVPVGFVFGTVYLIFASPAYYYLVVGLAIGLAGLFLRGWSAGHIRKNSELAASGPYLFTRNPLYLGSFVMGLGFMVASGVWWLGLVFVALYLGIYLPVMRIEAGELNDIFGSKFKEYEKAVPLFIPRPTAFESNGRKFEPGLYMRYREYQAAIGFVAGTGILIAKAYFFQ